MRLSKPNLRKSGFTLVELMLVVTIIAILAAIAIPRYANYQCKTKQVEARKGLGSMAKMQSAYFAEYSEYSTDLGRIGFGMKSGDKGYYDYEVLTASESEWQGRANGRLISFQGKEDVWTIDQSLAITNEKSACQ